MTSSFDKTVHLYFNCETVYLGVFLEFKFKIDIMPFREKNIGIYNGRCIQKAFKQRLTFPIKAFSRIMTV